MLEYEEKEVVNNVWLKKYLYLCLMKDCIRGFRFFFNLLKIELQYGLSFFICNDDNIMYMFFKYGREYHMQQIPMHIIAFEDGLHISIVSPDNVRE